MRTLGKDFIGTSEVTTPTDREIRVERVFNAARERVWRAFTDPKLLAQWWVAATSSLPKVWRSSAAVIGGTSSTAPTAFKASKSATAR